MSMLPSLTQSAAGTFTPLYTKEQLSRFISQILNGKQADQETASAAAFAVIDAFRGMDIKKNCEPIRKPGRKQKTRLFQPIPI